MTTPAYEQPVDIVLPDTPRPDPVPAVEGDEFVVEIILKHWKRGSGFQFLTLMKGEPLHDAEWLPTRNFVEKDGTNVKFLEYIRNHRILPDLSNWP